MEFSVDVSKMGHDAAVASRTMAVTSTKAKNEALAQIANMLKKMKSFIMEVNAKEVTEAQNRALPAPMLDRMTLTESRYNEMVEGVERVIALDDPIGEVIDGYTVPSGLKVCRRRVPLGVIGVIYESRPNVTIDIAALCIKSGNACILRGGSECFQTNLTLYELMQEVIGNSALPNHCVNFISATDRELVNKLLTLDEYVDVIIPRGGEALHRMCVKHATVPVIVGGFGVTHIYVDDTADIEKSVEIIINDKVQKPSACNALDTILVHRERAMALLHNLAPELAANKIIVHAHGEVAELMQDYPYLATCTAADLDTEFLGLHVNIVMVDGVNDALQHLRKHKAIHSDAILTNTWANAELFTKGAPSACVYVNASPRFSDGGQFGLGAEVAISTQKLHARGPMGLEALTTYQYVCSGDYLCRE